MAIIYVYYNPNNDKFYFKNCVMNSRYHTPVGTSNSYGHIIVQKLEIVKEKIYDLDYYENLCYLDKLKQYEKTLQKRKRKQIIKNYLKKLINHLIDLLYMFKSRF